jgi:thymidylate synthase
MEDKTIHVDNPDQYLIQQKPDFTDHRKKIQGWLYYKSIIWGGHRYDYYKIIPSKKTDATILKTYFSEDEIKSKKKKLSALLKKVENKKWIPIDRLYIKTQFGTIKNEEIIDKINLDISKKEDRLLFEQRNNYQDGDLGPIYGNSFTNFGGTYKSNDGFNQVEYLINELKNNKYSRRALINLWDPKVMTTDKVKLPTCHYSFQVLVGENNNLTGILTQRSGDWLPGVSANVYFYSAFLYMIAQQTGYVPYELVHNVADAHVYVNQIDAAKEYLSRGDYKSPKLMLNKASSIFDYKMNDFNFGKIHKFI